MDSSRDKKPRNQGRALAVCSCSADEEKQLEDLLMEGVMSGRQRLLYSVKSTIRCPAPGFQKGMALYNPCRVHRVDLMPRESSHAWPCT